MRFTKLVVCEDVLIHFWMSSEMLSQWHWAMVFWYSVISAEPGARGSGLPVDLEHRIHVKDFRAKFSAGNSMSTTLERLLTQKLTMELKRLFQCFNCTHRITSFLLYTRSILGIVVLRIRVNLQANYFKLSLCDVIR